VAQPAQNRAVEGDEYFLGGANIIWFGTPPLDALNNKVW